MVFADLVEETELGIEEIVGVTLIEDNLILLLVVVICESVHVEAGMTILQVDEGAETLEKLVVHLAIDVAIVFLGVVVVIEEVGLDEHVLSPNDLAEVVAIVFVPTPTQGCLQPSFVVEVERGDESVEVVVHLLLVDEVAFGAVVTWFVDVEEVKLFVGLVLLVIAIALGQMQTHVEREHRADVLVPQQLVVLLMVVVRLVLVIVTIAVCIIVFATGIVGAMVEALLILAGVVPGMIGFFLTVEGDELHHCVVAIVSGLEEVRTQSH